MGDFYNGILTPIVNNISSKATCNAFCIDENFYTYQQFGQCVSKIRNQLVKTEYGNKKVGNIYKIFPTFYLLFY